MDALQKAGSLPLQESESLISCSAVLRRGLELAMEHGPGHRHIDPREIYPISTGHCTLASSTPWSGFDFRQLPSELLCGL
jgi:hypothetical protein